jgi:hypothetical protein
LRPCARAGITSGETKPLIEEVALSSLRAFIAPGTFMTLTSCKRAALMVTALLASLGASACSSEASVDATADRGPASAPATSASSAKKRSPLKLVLERSTEEETCYRVESAGEVVVESSCYEGSPFVATGSPVVNISLQLVESRVAAIYVMRPGFEVTDVLAEPSDVEWGDAPSGWLLITYPRGTSSIELVMTSADGTIVCTPTIINPTCEEAPK